MRIFQESPLPSTCYVAEVALWVALGRVPQVLIKASDFGEDYSETDPRTNRAALDEDAAILPHDAGFSEAELRQMGIDADYEFYARTKTLVSTQFPHLSRPSGTEAVNALLSRESVFKALVANHTPVNPAAIEAIKEGVDWAREIDARCDAFIDLARAEVFRALTAGKLSAVAWRDAPGSIDFKDRRRDPPLVPIPADHWSMRKFNWEDSELGHSSGSYYAVQISTAGMLAAFPRPQCAPQPQTLDRYPGCIMVEDDAGSSTAIAVPRSRRVGRPNKGEGLTIKQIVLNYFGERALRIGEEAKREALVTDAMEFAERATRQKVGRTTVQGWFRDYRAAMPEIMPETRAD